MPQNFADEFDGADGTLLNGRAGTGGSWTCFGATVGDPSSLRLNGAGQLRYGGGNGCLGRIEAGGADHYAQARVQGTLAAAQAVAVAVRAIDHLNHIGMRAWSATQVELYKRVGSSTYTRIAIIGGLSLTTGQVWELRAQGTNVKPFVAGAQIGAAAGYEVTDAVFAGVTRAGLWAGGGAYNPVFDSFAAGTLGGAALGPADAALGLTAEAAALGVAFALVPDAAPIGTAAGTAALSWTGPVAPGASLLPVTAAEAAVTGMTLGPPGLGRATGVRGEPRLLAVRRERRMAAVPLS